MSPPIMQTSCPRRLIAVADCGPARARVADWIRMLGSTAAVAWFGHRIPQGVAGVRPAQAGPWLGRELDALVFETGPDVPAADALAIAAGLLRGGGVLLLLVAPSVSTPFTRRLQRFLGESLVHWLDVDETPPMPLPVRQGPRLRLNAGQARILRGALGLPERPGPTSVVLTAPRGRGKSTLLGALVGRWRAQGELKLAVTAPNPAAIVALLHGMEGELPGTSMPCDAGVPDFYVAPAQLLEARPRLDLLVVDEAAGLPVHTLLALAALAPRAIFATTTAGFEGSGRGFRLRFLEALRQRGGELREFRLERPVRWPPGDPLEDWVNRLFLLNAEAAAPGDLRPGRVRWLSGEWLAADERRLAAVVGLLSDAHYRTRPSDLQRWLDGPGVHIGLLETVGGGPLLGVLLAQGEPGLDAGVARAVWAGERRPPGQFLPCVLAGHGALDAARRPALRVARIAVHPRWQRRGLGRRLLRAARDFARRRGFGMIGASFGARPDLLRFWNGAGFRILRIGFRRETTSGLHAAVVLLGLQAGAREELDALLGVIAADWPAWRQGPLRDLDLDTADAVQRDLPPPRPPGPMADAESVQVFAGAGRPFELALPALRRWLDAHPGTLGRLEVKDAALLEAAVRGSCDWPRLSALAGESGRAGVIRALRQLVKRALQAPERQPEA
jgi:tRNA(Met) cytidine acetyltransferase